MKISVVGKIDLTKTAGKKTTKKINNAPANGVNFGRYCLKKLILKNEIERGKKYCAKINTF